MLLWVCYPRHPWMNNIVAWTVRDSIYRVAQKVSHKVLSISLPNTDRFSKFFHLCILCKICSKVVTSDVKSSKPKWPRGQNFGLGLKDLASASASASNIWPCPGLDIVVLLCNRAFFGQKSCKIREFLKNISGNNLKSYVVNHYLVLVHNCFWPRPWSQPPEIGLGLGLVALASASASRFGLVYRFEKIQDGGRRHLGKISNGHISATGRYPHVWY